jgi:hypothetical protein
MTRGNQKGKAANYVERRSQQKENPICHKALSLYKEIKKKKVHQKKNFLLAEVV